jgi:hypothetical protein
MVLSLIDYLVYFTSFLAGGAKVNRGKKSKKELKGNQLGFEKWSGGGRCPNQLHIGMGGLLQSRGHRRYNPILPSQHRVRNKFN